MSLPQISVIVPTLNEEQQISQTLHSIREGGSCELIVVDGGSTDGTRSLCGLADQFLTSLRGRAVQQNAGAVAASGEILLFLHADCRLPLKYDQQIQHAVKHRKIVGGCFQQRIDHPGRIYRWVERGNALRVHTLGWIYGDQGLFIRKDVFRSLGGFPAVPLMEDLYFSKRLTKAGRIAILPGPLVVSPRRWEQRGVVRQALRNWSFVARAHCGTPLETLAAGYPDIRERTTRSARVDDA